MTIEHKLINHIIDVIERGYVKDPDDSGGPTRYGITQAKAREHGYCGDMRHFPRSLAYEIYKTDYWTALGGAEIERLSPAIVAEIMDTGVNMGVSRAGEFLQRALNVFNNRGKIYPDVVVDGNIGPKTVEALRLYLNTRSEDVMLKALNSLQGAFYVTLSERREKDETFIYGWFKNRVTI